MWRTMLMLAATGCVITVTDDKGDGDSGSSDTDTGTDTTDTETDTTDTDTTPATGECGPSIPGNADVYSSFFGGVRDNETAWLCSGADFSAVGSGGTYFVEAGAILNVSGSNAMVYVVDGGEVNISGNNNTVVYEAGADVDENPSTTLVQCDPLTFDLSNAPNPGC